MEEDFIWPYFLTKIPLTYLITQYILIIEIRSIFNPLETTFTTEPKFLSRDQEEGSSIGYPPSK